MEESKESLRHPDHLRSRECSRVQNEHGRFGVYNKPDCVGNGQTEAGRGKDNGMSPEDMEWSQIILGSASA